MKVSDSGRPMTSREKAQTQNTNDESHKLNMTSEQVKKVIDAVKILEDGTLQKFSPFVCIASCFCSTRTHTGAQG
jgi:hypothetical protein